jgi:hypothetical protein
MRCALRWNDTRSRRIGQGFGPCCDVGMIAFGIYIELLSEVCVKGGEAVLAVEVLVCVTQE